jgi:hypothetical protein
MLDLTVTRRIVSTSASQDHFAAVREARSFNGVSFGVAVRKGRIEALERAGGYNDNWIGWAILALVAAFLVAGWVMQGG